MTDPTNPGDIVVYGQRRQSDGTFPTLGGGVPGGGANEPPGEDQNEITDPEYVPPPNPCDHPIASKIWNADARAVAAVAALTAKAASLNDGSNLTNREFGANLFLNSAGGVSLTDVSVGPTPRPGSIPEVTIEPGGTTYLNWMGDIHNHPSGTGLLSQIERDRFDARIASIQSLHPERSEINYIAAYVVVADSSAPTGYRVYAHTRDKSASDPGQEVNPNAQACPNA
jgi:hypothetical protein